MFIDIEMGKFSNLVTAVAIWVSVLWVWCDTKGNAKFSTWTSQELYDSLMNIKTGMNQEGLWVPDVMSLCSNNHGYDAGNIEIYYVDADWKRCKYVRNENDFWNNNLIKRDEKMVVWPKIMEIHQEDTLSNENMWRWEKLAKSYILTALNSKKIRSEIGNLRGEQKEKLIQIMNYLQEKWFESDIYIPNLDNVSIKYKDKDGIIELWWNESKFSNNDTICRIWSTSYIMETTKKTTMELKMVDWRSVEIVF